MLSGPETFERSFSDIFVRVDQDALVCQCIRQGRGERCEKYAYAGADVAVLMSGEATKST